MPVPHRWRSTARSARQRELHQPDGAKGGYTYGDFPTIGGTARGARLRRGLGADPVGPARSARPQGRATCIDHPRHGAVRRRPDACSTCATRSCRPTWSSTAARTAARSGRSSPTAAWAGTPAPSTAATRFPAEDFHVPPAPNDPRSTVSGQVLDAETGAPVAERARRDRRARLGLHRRLHRRDRRERQLHDQNVVHRHLPAGRRSSAPGYEVLVQPVTVTIGGHERGLRAAP